MSIICKAAVASGDGDFVIDEMITRSYPLEQLQQAFDDMLAGKNAKGVIEFE